MHLINCIKKGIFGLPLREAEFEFRNFSKGQKAQTRLEHVAKVVVEGYNNALYDGLSKNLILKTAMVKKELVGFFNEGIGMGLYTLDLISVFRKDRFWNFISGPGKKHEYMSYIGAGIACGVFKNRPLKKFFEKASPTSGQLLINGIGFYYAYFKPKRTLEKLYVPKNISVNEFYLYCYDNGIGRALWFYTGGSPEEIDKVIKNFPKDRRAGIWSGIGLAATYAGGVELEIIHALKAYAIDYHEYLAEGAILACHTRDVADNPHKINTTAEILAGKEIEKITAFANKALFGLGNERTINGKFALEYFFSELRKWSKVSEKEINNRQSFQIA